MKKIIVFLSFSFWFFSTTSVICAYNPYSTSSAVVKASVPSTSFTAPTLVSPSDQATTKNNRETLVWKRPSPVPVTPLHHYDLYLDGILFAGGISDSLTNQTYYNYTVTRQDDTFYLYPNTDLSEGYHTWFVTAYNTANLSVSSETRTFYVDSTSPHITLQKVDRQTLNWTTSDTRTIPDINLRGLSVTTPDPLLTGTVEPYANMQIILICPQNIRDCHDQSYLGNYPSGNWQHRFYGLIKGLIYTVYISSTDAAGNSVLFPPFFLAYGVKTPLPSAVITPTFTPTPTPPISPSVSPTPSPSITPEITPTPTFIPLPPVSPTPPIYNPVPEKKNYLPTLVILLAIGLPLHLLMTLFGTKTSLLHSLRLFFVLLFPFFGRKQYQTVPFSTLNFYRPETLSAPWQTKVSDINGLYQLPENQPGNLFTQITSSGRNWTDTIIESHILSIICLYPILETPQKPLNRVRHLSLTLRSFPLALAVITSAICLYLQPNYFFLTYLYLSLQLTFSEYLYPRFS